MLMMVMITLLLMPVRALASEGITTLLYRQFGEVKNETQTYWSNDLDGDGRKDKLVIDIKTKVSYLDGGNVTLVDSVQFVINNKKEMTYLADKYVNYDTADISMKVDLITLRNGKKYLHFLTKSVGIHKSILYSYTSNRLKKIYDLSSNYSKGTLGGEIIEVSGDKLYFMRSYGEYYTLTEKNGKMRATAGPSTVKLSKPSKIKITGGKSEKQNQMTIQWKPIRNSMIKYCVEYSQDKKFKKDVKSVSIDNPGISKLTDEHVQGGATYYVRIRAIKHYQYGQVYGKWSDVKKVVIKGVTVSINQKSVSIKNGETIQLKASVTGSKNKVLWSSQDKKIATVNSNGKVKGKKPGITTIVAKVGNTKSLCRVTVYEKSLSKREKVLNEYQNHLGKYYKSSDKFRLVNADKDSIPELLCCDRASGTITFYYWGNNGISQMMDFGITSAKSIYINRSKAIIVAQKEMFGRNWYTVYKNKKLVVALGSGAGDGKYYRTASDKTKTVSKKVFEEELNKYLKGTKKYTSKNMYENNDINRNKYLK